ncbi:hypothetical protein [uncultured Sphingomonas sp.]|uniref:hypothetical protein n=1 Tax=uncultured Sphingomonas sp. TaxID=158754 RepID=UPI0035CBBF1E
MGEDTKFRLGGLVSLIAAAAFGWEGIVLPLRAAEAHAPRVDYSIKIFVLVPALIVFGLFFLIGGARWQYRDPVRQMPTPIGWVLCALVAISSGASFYWLNAKFAALGYQ